MAGLLNCCCALCCALLAESWTASFFESIQPSFVVHKQEKFLSFKNVAVLTQEPLVPARHWLVTDPSAGKKGF
jgi:hypothetical protein